MWHVIALLACAGVIYLACEWFVNAVEWLGAQLKVGANAVGTVLAAIGTALPESVVTLVAALFGSQAQGADIAVGSAMGGPLVVGTIAYGVTGAMLLIRRRTRVPAGAAGDPLDGTDIRGLATDQRAFLAIFVFKVGLGLFAFAWKPVLGLLFFAAYLAYFVRELRGEDDKASVSGLEPLKLQPKRDMPSRTAVITQTLVTMAIIFLASHLFVQQLEAVGPMLGLSPVVVSLLLAPVATELPEVLNAVIWVRQGKADLALANISGAMMIQTTIPSGIGILLTDWHFDGPLILAGIVTVAAVIYLLVLFRLKRVTPLGLSLTLLFYLAFAVGLAILGGAG